MKTFLFSVTAISLTGAALANGNEWSALDREVETLASSLVDNHEGITIGGYVDIWYATGDYSVTGGDDVDFEEFSVNNARITLEGGSDGWGAYAEYALHDPNANFEDTVGYDEATPEDSLAENPSQLLDAYVTRELGDWMLQVGRFRNNMGASATMAERDMFFMNRSWIGNSYVGREEGIQVSGSPMEGINVSIGMSNGTDTPDAVTDETDDTRLTIHADYTMDAITAGISFTDDGDSGGSGIVLDLGYEVAGIAIGFEYAEFDDVKADGTGGSGATSVTSDGSANPFNESIGAYSDLGSDGRSPMALSLTYPIDDAMTVGLRHQIADDEAQNGRDDFESTDLALTYEGYTLQYSTAEFGPDLERDMILLGFQVGF